jgi:hypothetical protein
VKRYLAMNRYIGGKIVQPTVKRTSSFINIIRWTDIYIYSVSPNMESVETIGNENY